VGETRVDILHLLEDLRDAYPGSLEETVVTEIVANSLDSGAARIAVAADPSQNALLVTDDGTGMKRRELARFHDIAASRKTRGEGIGFAGVGIKLALLASEEVVTETRRGKIHVATRWRLASRHKAPWKWIPPPGLVGEHGTGVSLKASNPLSPLTDGGFLEATIRSHFQPLFEPDFEEILSEHYPRPVSFEINGSRAAGDAGAGTERAEISLRLSRKRKPSASGYLERSTDGSPLAPDRRGIGVSAFGKVIKRGWDWLGIFPQNADRIGGLIEAPGLAGCLTLNKTDFIRVGPKGAVYLAYRKAIQEAVTRQLALWGDGPDAARARERRTRPLERDLEAVLMDLAEEFPLLEALVDRHFGGQKKLPSGRPATGGTGAGAPAAIEVVHPGAEPRGEEPDVSPVPSPRVPEEKTPGPESPPGTIPQPGASGPRRPLRYGLSIEFEDRPDSDAMGRLAESTVWINEAHPAYRRAAASRSEGYHVALAAALALSSVAVEPASQQAFLNAFFASWGEALSAGRRPSPKKR
jgi:hypothetical protein